jgi:hypothetical protein
MAKQTLSDEILGVELRQARDQIKQLRAALAESERHRAEAEAIRQNVFGLTQQTLAPPKWTVKLSAGKSEHIPVLVLGDFHWGEEVDAGRMGGANEYTIAIAEQAYRTVVTKAIDIATTFLPQNTYPGVIVLRLGDMLSGYIHADLTESNEKQPLVALPSLMRVEGWGLRALADAFGRVHVMSVAGNHGRMTLKPNHKRGAWDNLDTIAAWWLESEFKTDKRFSWHTPESGDAVFHIYGRRYVATHGHTLGGSGGMGFIGPAAPAVRGIKRLHASYAAMGKPVAAAFIGHFHVSLQLEEGWTNGSLVGYAEYGRDHRMRPSAPTQWLVFFHPKGSAAPDRQQVSQGGCAARRRPTAEDGARSQYRDAHGSGGPADLRSDAAAQDLGGPHGGAAETEGARLMPRRRRIPGHIPLPGGYVIRVHKVCEDVFEQDDEAQWLVRDTLGGTIQIPRKAKRSEKIRLLHHELRHAAVDWVDSYMGWLEGKR